MSFLDNVFNKKRPEILAAQQQNTGGGAMGQQQPANAGAHPGTMTQQDPNKPVNPLDGFAHLWAPKLDAAGKPITAQHVDFNAPYLTAVKDEDLTKAASGIDFLSGVDPELMTKATSGDIGALKQLMNHVGQQAFVNSTKISSGLANQSAHSAATRVNAALDSQVRNLAIRDQNPVNEALLHENVKPLFDATKLMIANNNPKMSAVEVAKEAERYLLQLGSATAPKVEDPKTTAQNNAPDWTHIG